MTTPPAITTLAIDRGLAGDRAAGLALLQPLVAQGPTMTVAVLSMLAEVASLPARARQPAGSFLTLAVSSVDTGQPGSADDLPGPVRFAAQFTAAHSNGDRDHAYALFDAFAAHCIRQDCPDIRPAVAALYDMAVASAQEIAQHGRRPS